jgi:hypothetical protein
MAACFSETVAAALPTPIASCMDLASAKLLWGST